MVLQDHCCVFYLALPQQISHPSLLTVTNQTVFHGDTCESLVKNRSGTSEKFNGKSYLLWTQSFETFITAYRKMSHLAKPPPDSKDATYDDWFADDAAIVSWLVNSMESTITRGFMMLRPA